MRSATRSAGWPAVSRLRGTGPEVTVPGGPGRPDGPAAVPGAGAEVRPAGGRGGRRLRVPRARRSPPPATSASRYWRGCGRGSRRCWRSPSTRRSRAAATRPGPIADGAAMAAVDWQAAVAALEAGRLPCPGGEGRILGLTAGSMWICGPRCRAWTSATSPGSPVLCCTLLATGPACMAGVDSEPLLDSAVQRDSFGVLPAACAQAGYRRPR